MENKLPKFLVGAKVFAKMKGYTAWPAIIDGIHPYKFDKFKYDVFFYGTNQVGSCREDELKPYVENRKSLGRLKHYRGFNEAIKQMDLELGLVYTPDVGHTNERPECEDEAGQVLEKRGRGRSRSQIRSRTMSVSETPIRTRSRSASINRSETTIKRGRGRPRSKSQSGSRPVSPSIEKPIRTRSRSRSACMSRSDNTTVKRGRGRPKSLSCTRSEPSEDNPTYKPKSRSRSHPRTSQAPPKRSLSLSSDTYVKPNLKTFQCIINPHIASLSERKEALEFLKNEAVLNDAIFGIQACLSLDKADLEAATKYLDEFLILDLNPLLLKKHPEAVDTFEKLQRYDGNSENWNMPITAKKQFQHDLKIINTKSNIIYNRIKELFHIPDGKNFSQVFKEELNKFEIAIEGIPIDTVWKMTRDPTSV